jgi:glycosyltransferase involved in cell wall biosynthesis
MPEPLDGRSFVVTTYYWRPYVSGLTVYIARIAEALAERGARVTAIVARHEPSLPGRAVVNGVDVHRLPVLARLDRGPLVPRLVGAVRRAAREADTVIVPLPFGEAGAVAAARPAGTRLVVLHVCDPETRSGGLGRVLVPVVDASARGALRRADVIGVLSRDYAEHSRVVGPFAASAVELPPAVDYAGLAAPAPAPAGAGPAGAGRIGYLGRLTHEKGLDVLVRAAARLHEPTVVLAGPSDVAGGDEAEALARLAAELGVALELPGPVPPAELAAFYASLDCFVLPSVNGLEAWGMVQAEAMLCGTPVVASALPGVRQLVTRTGMGRLARPRDDADLAAAIGAVLADPHAYVRDRQAVIAALGLDRALDDAVAAVAG